MCEREKIFIQMLRKKAKDVPNEGDKKDKVVSDTQKMSGMIDKVFAGTHFNPNNKPDFRYFAEKMGAFGTGDHVNDVEDMIYGAYKDAEIQK